ncbi:MAG: hypothetical protein F6K40_10310 [Okeania sp. SIO3I5]|uniref:hypothetical protein n=1 Tax=Okeania sp. SIO3I5 TaxID=2607805 RepID=UPI0013B88513|nr:hypothetical protein [Okeania sp. SIO3I5]NEQ36648.1 hypothetical protein [Okeania sp. SIO3I5]
MSEKPVFKINQKLFKQLNDWQEKMDAKERNEAAAEVEVDANNQDKKLSDSQKEKD